MAKSFGQGHFENGPEILLDDPASLEDLYLRLKSELKPIEKSKYEKEKTWYSSLSFDEKIEEIIKILQEISKNQEAVFFICQSGFFDENGYLTLWARKIFDKLLYKEEIKIAIISNRQPRSEDIFGMKNVLAYNISQLENKFVLALVEELSLDRIGKVHSLEKEYIPVIGGHPVLAYAYVDLLKQNISSSVDSIIGIISS